MQWRLRRVVPAAAVTTHPKPHAQQQLAPPQPIVLSIRVVLYLIRVVRSLFIRSYVRELTLQSTNKVQTVERGVEEI